jgi:hypothetical protein
MVEPDNGRLLNPMRKRHNAKRCRVATRQAIIYALANGESVESIRRNYRASRHTVLAIREQYPHEIEAAQQRIKALIEGHCIELAHKALDKIERKIAGERSWTKLLKITDALQDKVQSFDRPVQTHPEPMSIKLAALRRAKRNELSVPSA